MVQVIGSLEGEEARSSNKHSEELEALLVICHSWISSFKTSVPAKGETTRPEMRTYDIAQHCSGYSHSSCHDGLPRVHSAGRDIVCAECSVVRLDFECAPHNTVTLGLEYTRLVGLWGQGF